jgi:hypothetical protein
MVTGQLFRRVKPWEVLSDHDNREERISKVYSKKTQRFIESLENAWDRYLHRAIDTNEDAFKILYKHPSMKFLVGTKIDKFTKAWAKKGMTREDFTSLFWEKAWEVTKEHDDTDWYFLYEKIPKALETTGIDYVRSCLNVDKRKANYYTVGYKDTTSFRFESDVETKVLIEQNCEGLEKELLLSYLECPSISYTELGRLHGISHHQQVKRILQRALGKLQELLQG